MINKPPLPEDCSTVSNKEVNWDFKKLTKPFFGVVQPSLAFAGCVWLHL
jgi:hypothetical protein